MIFGVDSHSSAFRHAGPFRIVDRTVARIAAWKLWSLNTTALWYLGAIEVLAVALAATSLLLADLTAGDLATAGVLAGLAVLYGELGDRVDRFRRYLATERGPYVEPTSVWTLAAVLLLPVGYVAAVVVVLYLHACLRGYRHASWLPHRLAFTASSGLLGALAATVARQSVWTDTAALPHGLRVALVSAAAVLAFHVVNHGTVAVMIYLATRPARFTDAMLGRAELGLEFMLLAVGVAAAIVYRSSPWLVPGALPFIAMMHRGALTVQLHDIARTDGKTGLLNAATWRAEVEAGLRDPSAPDGAVVLFDLDGFKQINDTHGHLAGDAVLRAVAHCLVGAFPADAVVGRFGGDEFAVFVPALDADAAEAVADAVTRRLSALTLFSDGSGERIQGIGASCGVAFGRAGVAELDVLLAEADSHLYADKRSRRAAR